MTNFTKPILAASLLTPSTPHTDGNILSAMVKLRYPVLATLKMDGIRAIRMNDLFSRTLHLIPNISIRRRSMILPAGFDMELWNPSLQYDEVESIVMSEEHDSSELIEFHVLDWYREEEQFKYYQNRVHLLDQECDKIQGVWFEQPTLCTTARELFEFFLRCESEQGEGICFRSLNSLYKQGRSTLKEQHLVKFARFETAEAVIVGMEEQMYNGNRAKRNAVGAMDRASHQHKLRGKDTLGALIVKDTKTGVEFRIGTGFNDIVRYNVWHNQEMYVHKTIVYRCKKHGEKIKPRCPSFKGFRKEIDIL